MKCWHKKLIQELLNGNPLEFDKVVAIKEDFIPDRLYKYCSVNENAINNLNDSVVYLSWPNDFNDPYDAGFLLNGCSLYPMTTDIAISNFEIKTGTCFSDEGKKLLKQGKSLTEAVLEGFPDDRFDKKIPREKLKEVGEQIEKKYLCSIVKELENNIKRTLRICCFTTRLDNMSMWHHYANGHSGICIEYDTHGFCNIFRRLLFPVIYGETRFDASRYLQNIRDMKQRPRLFPFYASIFKSKDWAYEDEWRLVIPGGCLEECPLVNAKINAVYLGRKISDDNKQRVLNVCKKNNIKVYQLDLCDSKKYTLATLEIIT